MTQDHNMTFELHLPEVQGNRIRFSWTPNGILKKNEYWVEYLDLDQIEASPGKLTESLFPLCLAFSALGAHIKLPVQISKEVLNHWRTVIQISAFQCFRAPVRYSLQNGSKLPDYEKIKGSNTILCFGGGTESLLTLGYLMDRGIRPFLASFGGPGWTGSDPEKNPDKFRMDETLSRDFELDLLRIRSNFREVFRPEDWEPYLKKDVSMINSVLLLPLFLSFITPVSEMLGIRRIVSGNERMNFPKEYFCFSPRMTGALYELAEGLIYESFLSHLYKEDVCRELYQEYPEYAAYQYSCWRNHGQRWCHRCESCLEYFALLRNYGVNPALVGLDENEIRNNRQKLVMAVSHSAESRPGELWLRMCDYPNLRRDPFIREMLDEIRRKSTVYHSLKNIYNQSPDWMRKCYRKPKALFQRIKPAELLQHAGNS